MNRIFTMLLMMCATAVYGEEQVASISFEDAHAAGMLKSGSVNEDNVLIFRAGENGIDAPIIALPKPAVTMQTYAVRGLIRYSDVIGNGYLQMDNDFGDRGTFFTKSLAPGGPLGAITGSSDWRPFVLPFFASPGDQSAPALPSPENLTLSLHLPGSGTVEMKNVALHQYAAGENPLPQAGLAGNGRTLGLVGGISGAVLGLWGAVIGTLSGLGRGRTFVMASISLFGILGAASVIAGVGGLITGQRSELTLALILVGVLMLAVLGMRRSIRRRYEEHELRRMRSVDA